MARCTTVTKDFETREKSLEIIGKKFLDNDIYHFGFRPPFWDFATCYNGFFCGHIDQFSYIQ